MFKRNLPSILWETLSTIFWNKPEISGQILGATKVSKTCLESLDIGAKEDEKGFDLVWNQPKINLMIAIFVL